MVGVAGIAAAVAGMVTAGRATDEPSNAPGATTVATATGPDVARFNDDVRTAVVPALAFANGVHVIARDLRAGSLTAEEVRRRAAAYEDQLAEARASLGAVEAPPSLRPALELQRTGIDLYAAASRALGRAEGTAALEWVDAAVRLKLLGDHVFDRGRVATSMAAGAASDLLAEPVPDFAAEGVAAGGSVGPPAPERPRAPGAWRDDADAIAPALGAITDQPAMAFARASGELAARFEDLALTEAGRVLRLALLVAEEAGAIERRGRAETGPAGPDRLAADLADIVIRLWSAAAPIAGVAPVPG